MVAWFDPILAPFTKDEAHTIVSLTLGKIETTTPLSALQTSVGFAERSHTSEKFSNFFDILKFSVRESLLDSGLEAKQSDEFSEKFTQAFADYMEFVPFEQMTPQDMRNFFLKNFEFSEIPRNKEIISLFALYGRLIASIEDVISAGHKQ